MMRLVTQTILAGNPDGVPGNCLQAAVASLLDLDLDAVPHFVVHDDWLERLRDFAQVRGYRIVYTPPAEPPVFGLAVGPSIRGVIHAVAFVDGEMWDPHPSRAGLVSVSNYIAWLPGRPCADSR
jgi:hypothetical protein